MGLEPDPLTTALAEAKVAIETGNYGQAVRLLEPLCEACSPLQPGGDSLRLLLATALMGQGQAERAAACCRSLLSCANPHRRAQARDLLQVLEAPVLKRPRNWSLTLPRLDQAEPLEGVARPGRASLRPKVEAPEHPPVGPTQSPRGFVALALLVLVAWLLTALLSGCLRVETQLDFAGPGRMHVRHRLEPIAGTPLPFQNRLAAALAAGKPPYQVTQEGDTTLLDSPLLTPVNAGLSLKSTIDQAAQLAGLSLPAPALDWQERNWLIGVQQHIQIRLDLQTLPPLPGLALNLRLQPLTQRSIRSALPLPVQPAGGRQALIWPLKLGQINTLDIQCWRWNPLGVGALLIAAGLLLVVQLQRMRVRLGMGLPELPA
jgi:hypothetical protein